MSVRVLTLFGEEIIPEQMNAVGRPAKTKKAKEPAEEKTDTPQEPSENIPTAEQSVQGTTATLTPTTDQEQTTNTAVKRRKKTVLKRRATPEEIAVKTAPQPEDDRDFLDGWEGDKQYYSIGEVAALFRVNTSHIRFWTNEFELKVRTTRKGDRLYTPEQIREVRRIYYLVKEKKYTIKGAKAKLKEKPVSLQTLDLKRSLLHLRNKLLTIRNQLT